ncbi:MAG: Cas8a1 family CRISPR/Cas system-associated protein [Nanoarchaeota archaeon]
MNANDWHMEPTGNSFVDTGLSVITVKAGKESITDLTKEDLQKVVGDGVWLAKANRQLKAFYMVVGINSPLTNPSLKKDDKGLKKYASILTDLANDSIESNVGGDVLCEVCGKRTPTNVLHKYDIDIGREWFPLAGSLGNDAQALPSASRAPRICSLCLLSIQFLPLGTMVLNGKLACFQSTQSSLTQHIVKTIYEETDKRLQTLNISENLPAVGQGEGSKKATMILVNVMEKLQTEYKAELELSHQTELTIWLFSNSGQNPDCEIIEIPNPAVNFLWNAVKSGHRQEIENLLRKESKKPEYQILNCIIRKTEYLSFYPYKGAKPSSKELFELYQTAVLGTSSYALKLAEWMATQIKLIVKTNSDEKILKKLIKEDAIRSKDKSLITQINKVLVDLTENGLFNLEEYVTLFPYRSLHPVSARIDAYRWIWFYLNHDELCNEKIKRGEDEMFANPKIKSFTKDMFDYYRAQKGLNYIKKNILDAFRGGKIYTSDLQTWFSNLGVDKDGYTNEDWDNLCRDENGDNNLWELKFQLRLELTNLYRLAMLETKK